MGNVKAQRAVSIILALFIIFLVYKNQVDSNALAKIRDVDRSGMVLLADGHSDSGDYPFVSRVELISETSSEVVFDVKYFKSKTVGGLYTLSVHPFVDARVSDWQYSENTLEAGMNVLRVKLLYKPRHIARLKSETSDLLLYITHNNDPNDAVNPDVEGDLEGSMGNTQSMGKIFERNVDFPKIWMK